MLEKISDLPNWGQYVKSCDSPSHRPPSHMVYEPGVYRWTCPQCGHVTTFTVSRPTLGMNYPEILKSYFGTTMEELDEQRE